MNQDGEVWAEYQNLIDFYLNQVKPTIVTAETLDRQSRLNLSAINELRSALDHIARAHGSLYKIIDRPDSYASENLRNAKNHMVRAYCDAFDVIGISIKKYLEEFRDVLPDGRGSHRRRISTQAYYAVIGSDRGRELQIRQDQALASLAKLKAARETPESIDITTAPKEFETAIAELRSVRDELLEALPRMIEYDKERDKERLGPYLWTVIGALVGIGGLIYGIMQHLGR